MVDLMNKITIEIICEDGDDKLTCNAMYTWSDSYMTCFINTHYSLTSHHHALCSHPVIVINYMFKLITINSN